MRQKHETVARIHSICVVISRCEWNADSKEYIILYIWHIYEALVAHSWKLFWTVGLGWLWTIESGKDDTTVQLVLHAILMTSTMCRCAAMSVMRTREIKEGLLRSIDRRQLLSSRCVRNMRPSPGYTPFAWWSADVSEMQTARNI